ncbi:hypothetical protein DS909_15760 [Phaeobacter gallaeciensis]|uniref:Uncharacterized protein n=2 Tax=Roseobacteraceae TaxID=2854170 RepID=A0A366WRQ4_9RHOB|nr:MULTISPECIES: hypothetical protein [Roseobacteraceae]MBT3140745.1 hypothetical protein [Falsiruegeria litorea]MBT8170489.1 hypothetical protein [Falsiruegeria litorea]RBW52705.1 hypothetical protein DS909_15760 [Phaeobacter gallaeciensis]
MTAVQTQTFQTLPALSSYENKVPLMICFAPNWPIRTVLFRIVGTALILGSATMWIFPGSNLSADLALMKLGTSLFFLLCGLALLMMHHVDNQPEAYFDSIRREVRVLQKNNRGRPQTVLRRSYDSLGSVRFNEHFVELFDVDGSLLMRLPIETAEIRHTLRTQLSDHVTISA